MVAFSRASALMLLLMAVHSHAQDDEEMDEDEALELRNSLTWGRMFLDNAVTHHQYFKARFGGDIPLENHPVLYADPPLGCTLPKNDVKGKVVFVDRGECTFTTKARLMQKAGAAAMMVVGHDASLTHLPGPDGTDIEIPVAMVTGEYGEYIKALSSRQESKVSMIPIHCEKESGVSVCLPVTAAEKAAHNIQEGGHLELGSDKFEYLSAKFGTPMPAGTVKLGVADPIQACGELDAEQFKGQAVLVKRGGCPFLDKVSNVQRAGAVASILINTQPGILRMDSLKRYESYNISIAAVMITTSTGDKLSKLAGSDIKFLASEITAAVWDGLRNSVTAEQWPLDFEESKEMFLKLKQEHESSSERIEYLENAFRDTGMEAEDYLDAGNQEL